MFFIDRIGRAALDIMLFQPSREVPYTPAIAGLDYVELDFDASDGVALHGWWMPTTAKKRGHILFAHGNGGSITDRILHAHLLVDAGFDVLLFDYRGYGRSTGRPTEAGTYLDARAARTALLARDGVDPERVFYLGESLGGGVVVELATEFPPAGVILTSAFSSVRDVAKVHFRLLPTPLVPDAYPSAERLATLGVPVLIQHGADDELVPVEQARHNFRTAAQPKRLQIVDGAGHNDLVLVAGADWVSGITDWAAETSV
ncbi:MAG: alpha/beta hydrolase [Rhodococcus fascians]